MIKGIECDVISRTLATIAASFTGIRERYYVRHGARKGDENSALQTEGIVQIFPGLIPWYGCLGISCTVFVFMLKQLTRTFGDAFQRQSAQRAQTKICSLHDDEALSDDAFDFEMPTGTVLMIEHILNCNAAKMHLLQWCSFQCEQLHLF